MSVDSARLSDLIAFARIEVESGDLEPWAILLRAMRLRNLVTDEQSLWLVKLYNAYDDFGSAWNVCERWATPMRWSLSGDRADAAVFSCSQERRGLRGGRVLRHLDSYVSMISAWSSQRAWLARGICGNPECAFLTMLDLLRGVWGVGRQTAFEWAEFLAKVNEFPISAPDAQLWESSGPRRSIQRLYGNPMPSLGWLNEKANECRDLLRAEGIPLAWEDFETVICDFNVMRDGRYYPGKHLAALREEIETIHGPWHDVVLGVFESEIPALWNAIPPGIDKMMMSVYRDTGKIPMPKEW